MGIINYIKKNNKNMGYKKITEKKDRFFTKLTKTFEEMVKNGKLEKLSNGEYAVTATMKETHQDGSHDEFLKKFTPGSKWIDKDHGVIEVTDFWVFPDEFGGVGKLSYSFGDGAGGTCGLNFYKRLKPFIETQ